MSEYKKSKKQLINEKNNAYFERNKLVRFLACLYPSHLMRHPADDIALPDEWRWIICIHTSSGQLTWHIHDSELASFAFLQEQPGHWDGHTTDQKYKRLEEEGGKQWKKLLNTV